MLLCSCLFGFCLLSPTFSLATASFRLSGFFGGLFTRPAVTFSSPLSFIPPPLGKERGGGGAKRSLCSPTLSITPCLRLRTAARLLVKPRRVPPQKSGRSDDPSRSPSRATSATLPHVSPIHLPPGTPLAASRPLLCE